MIGTGNGEEYITGFEKSNMGEILQKTGFTIQNSSCSIDLNATLARLGVPCILFRPQNG
jgi:hypothetical protein